MSKVLFNAATWADEDHPPVPEGWPVVNAPRPLAGEITWEGPFRHGIFYAASPQRVEGTFGWDADDAWPVDLITNEDITTLMMVKLKEHGFTSAEEAGLTIAELAASYNLPWADDKTEVN